MQTNAATKKMVYCALLIALSALLGGALRIPAFLFGVYSVKISLGALPVILAGVLFGPLYGGLAGGLADILQANLFPLGAYQPWFTVVGMLFGLIPGLFFMKKQKPTIKRLFLAVGCGQITGSVICNTALITILYQLPFMELLIARLITQAIMIPLFVLMLRTIIPLLPFRGETQ